jgi:hypothetical protein
MFVRTEVCAAAVIPDGLLGNHRAAESAAASAAAWPFRLTWYQ